MARRPTRDQPDMLTEEDLKQIRERLARLGAESVRQAYHTAYARCRMVNNKVPSPRAIQELVQTWKQLRKFR